MVLKKSALFLLALVLAVGYVFVSPDNPAENGTPKIIDSLLKKLEKTGDPHDRVAILRDLCREYSKTDLGKTLKYAEQGMELSERIDYPEGRAIFLNIFGLVNKTRGDYDQALDYYFKSLKIAEDIGDKNGIVRAYNNIGVVYRNRGDYDRALDYYFKTLKVTEEIGNKKVTASIYNNIGLVYAHLDNYNKALDYYFKSLKIKKALGDKKGTTSTYNNIGLVFFQRGDYSQALDYYFKSLQIEEEVGDKVGTAESYNSIGDIYFNQGNYASALEYYFKTLQIVTEMGNKRGVADAYHGIGSVYEKQQDYQQAIQYYSNSLKIREELGDKTGIAVNLNSMGQLYLVQKEFRQALEYFLKSKKICEAIGDKSTLASAYQGMGACYHALGKNNRSVEYLTRALNLARDIDNPNTVKETAETLSRVYAQNGQYEKAYQYHVLFKEKSDALSNEENVKNITRLEMQYQFEKKQKQQELEQQKRDMEKEAELKQQKMLKYMFSGIAVLLALVFYARYRLKLSANRELNSEIQERKKTEAELLKSMKLEAVGILARGIAHDFNNLLAVILGGLAMAKETIDNTEKSQRFIYSAENASTQAAELVQKFLTLSDGEWARKDKVTLSAIFEDTKRSSSQIKKIPVFVYIPEDLKPLCGDERQLRQVLVNLLLNAREAVSDLPERRKRINLSAENTALPEDNEWSLKQGEYVKVSISDNGRGIPPDLLDKIFDPYFSTKRRSNQKGMGMGLAICQAVIQKHEGHIDVISKPGEGTTVSLYLPVFGTSETRE